MNKVFSFSENDVLWLNSPSHKCEFNWFYENAIEVSLPREVRRLIFHQKLVDALMEMEDECNNLNKNSSDDYVCIDIETPSIFNTECIIDINEPEYVEIIIK